MLRAEDEAPTSWLIPRVRSALYDSENLLSAAHLGRRNKGKGIRAWYTSYTTIDWLHDDIREQARLRTLRAIGGTKGWWLNNVWDPVQGWLLVVLIGLLCGLFAGFISEWTELFAGWKTGYCRADWRLSQPICCRLSAVECEYWHVWEPRMFSRTAVFVAVGGLYTLVAAFLVVKSATRVTMANHGVSSSVETSVSPTVKMAYYGAGSGIPEVKSILAGFVIHGFLGVRILIVKTFGLILCCASGIMAGKEGPMVQIAASLGNISTRIFDKYYKNEAKKREIISAAAAAGVSVAFGAPIGGVLFSLEEVSYFFPNKTMLRSLTCALVAALILKAYDPFGTGKLVLFQTTYDMDYHWFEMLAFVIIGIFGGLYGALFCRLNMAINRLRKNTWVGRFPILEVVVVTAATLAVSYQNPFTRIGLGELVGSLFQECPTNASQRPHSLSSDDEGEINKLLCLWQLLNRSLFAIITFGIKVPSGLVLPSMSIGAIFGRIVGTYMEYLTRAHTDSSLFAQCPSDSRCVIPGIYALVGAGATLTGATHTTIAVVAILMELTGNLIYTLPVLVGVMTARWIAEYFSPSGIYDMLLEHAGHPYFDTKTQYIHTRRTAAELMQTDLETVCVDFENENSLALLSARLSRISQRGLGDGGFPVVNSRGHLLGWIACAELEFAIARCSTLDPSTVCFFNNPLWQMDYPPLVPESTINVPQYKDRLNDFTPFVDQTPLTISANSPIELVANLLSRLGISYLCVVDKGVYCGVIFKKAYIGYVKELEEAGYVR
ncbi:clc channel [Coemansia mojavensis]|nr:clc channel [Coemansia mojavensis]